MYLQRYTQIRSKVVICICPPLPCICTYLCKYTYERVEKTWLFPIISLEKGSKLFARPVKLSRVAKKNQIRRKYQNCIRREPCELGRRPFNRWNIIKVHYFPGGGVLVIQTSWILLNMVNNSQTSHFQKELEPKPKPVPKYMGGSRYAPPSWSLGTLK